MKKMKLDIQHFSIPYTYLDFEDLPSTETPVSATNLNTMQNNIHNETMDDIENAITGDLVVNSIKSKNMFDKNNVLMGYELNRTDGTVSVNSNYYVSDYIHVKPGVHYYLTKAYNGSSNCFYDINKNFISTINKENGEITIPDDSNIYYMRFNGPPSDLDNVQFEAGSVATEYRPHQQLTAGYELLTDNGWQIKKYDNGMFEAWLPNSTTNSTTTSSSAFGGYITGTLSIPKPSLSKSLYHVNINASFATQFSFPLYWEEGNNIAYRIVAVSQISTSTRYRLSGYISGTWR